MQFLIINKIKVFNICGNYKNKKQIVKKKKIFFIIIHFNHILKPLKESKSIY